MTDPIRAALERLIARLDETTDPNGPVPAWSDAYLAALAALSQPAQPAEGDGEWPTDEQLIEAYQRAYQPAWERGEFYGCHIDGLRAAIALDRSRHPAPVPVSERLPGPEDCDAEGRCWWFNPGQPAMSNPHIATSSWRLCRMLSGKPMGTHWIPAHALPMPATTHDTESND